jgi:hypothetical protein
LQEILPPEGGDTNFTFVLGYRSRHQRFLSEFLSFGEAAPFDTAPWGLQAGHACPLFFNSFSICSSRVVRRGQSCGTAISDANSWGARFAKIGSAHFNRECDFAQDSAINISPSSPPAQTTLSNMFGAAD